MKRAAPESMRRAMKMKVLVYGSGVIGCYLAHVLCTAGNDVTLLAGRPDLPMPNWRALKTQMPGWDSIRKQYGSR